MAEIINLDDRRKKERPSLQTVVSGAVEHVTADWEKFARTNKLNDFFTQSAGVWADSKTNYLADLNAVSSIEQKLGMTCIIKAPFGAQIGWRAGFFLKSGMAYTNDMPFETYARCFSVLLFIKLKRELFLVGMEDEL